MDKNLKKNSIDARQELKNFNEASIKVLEEKSIRSSINLFDFVISFLIKIEKIVLDLKTYGQLFLNLFDEIKIIENKRIDAIK